MMKIFVDVLKDNIMILANDHLSLQTRFSPSTNNQIKLEPSSSTSSSASPASDSDDTINVSSPIRQSTSTQDIMSVSPKSENLNSIINGESSSPQQNNGNSNEKSLNIQKPTNINTLSSSNINSTMDFSVLLNSINSKEQLLDRQNCLKDKNISDKIEKGILSSSITLQDIIPKLPSMTLDNIHSNNFINTFTQGDPNAILQLSQLLTNSGNSNLFSGTNFPNFGGHLNNTNIQSNKKLSQDSILNSTINNMQQSNGNEKKRTYPYTFQYCVLCQKNVHSSKLPCHIRQCHVAKPMFRCPSCDFTSTYSKNNVKSHMVSLHGLAGDPISYMDQYSSQVEEYMKKCFPNVRGRGRPVHGRNSPKSPQTKRQQLQTQINMIPEQGNVNHLSGPGISGQINQFNMMYNPLFNKNINPSFGTTLTSQNRFSNPQIPTSVNQLNTSSFQHPPPPTNWGNLPVISNGDKNYTPVMMQTNPLNIFPYLNNTLPKGDCSLINIQDGVKLNLPSISEGNIKKHKQDNLPTTSIFNITSVSDFLANLKNKSPEELNDEYKVGDNEVKLNRIMMDEEFFKPKYFGFYPYNTFCLLDENFIKNTIFDISIDDYQKISKMIKKSSLDFYQRQKQHQEERLLSFEEQSRIDEIKKELKAQPFEILFALHKYDISVLTAEDVSLIFSIAPTSVDILRIKKLTQYNKLSLTEAESFISQLASIENLPKKIYTMNFIYNKFNNLYLNIMNHYKKISTLVKQLSQNNALNELFKIILISLNTIYSIENEPSNNNNDKNLIDDEKILPTIKGFTFETLEKLFIPKIDKNLSNNESINTKFNDIFKKIVGNIYIEESKKQEIEELSNIMKEILNLNFDEIETFLSIIEESFQILENEKNFMTEKSQEIVTKFIESSCKNMIDIKKEKIKAKNTIDACITFFCASKNYGMSNSSTKSFFLKLNEILKNLITAF
ncbi:Formin, FH2 domain-containing protein [Strongyloides ratti]|uniref:Formin, FH2 domain-containing protein n=1 Tax=Strongyloides ratti TaxID=34506 RepID=A0A090LFR8_STRRB|nr:Formin, FH2 domain-containing protein [Strongyloides ratti]CEF66993.1 Formin, FH2 domain-containing protein [Strongyloides ratti]